MKLTDIAFLTIRGALGIFLRIWNRYRAFGAENIPATGGCVLASNHVSYLDPPALSCATGRRKAWFLARNTLFFGRPLFFQAMHCIPLNREHGEVSALRRAIKLLKSGHMLALFPEGTRSETGELQKGQSGIGFIVTQAHVPVVPAWIEGTFKAYPKHARWVRPCKVRTYYGKPIMPEEFDALGSGRDAHQRISDLIMERITSLRDAAQSKNR